jgi:hypothetical protein
LQTLPADSAPLLFLTIAASMWQILCALQIVVRNEAHAHNVVVMSSLSVTKSNLQIGTLQIDLHEPAVRLSQAVISIYSCDLHLTRLVWLAGSPLRICFFPGNAHTIACKRRYTDTPSSSLGIVSELLCQCDRYRQLVITNSERGSAC